MADLLAEFNSSEDSRSGDPDFVNEEYQDEQWLNLLAFFTERIADRYNDTRGGVEEESVLDFGSLCSESQATEPSPDTGRRRDSSDGEREAIASLPNANDAVAPDGDDVMSNGSGSDRERDGVVSGEDIGRDVETSAEDASDEKPIPEVVNTVPLKEGSSEGEDVDDDAEGEAVVRYAEVMVVSEEICEATQVDDDDVNRLSVAPDDECDVGKQPRNETEDDECGEHDKQHIDHGEVDTVTDTHTHTRVSTGEGLTHEDNNCNISNKRDDIPVGESDVVEPCRYESEAADDDTTERGDGKGSDVADNDNNNDGDDDGSNAAPNQGKIEEIEVGESGQSGAEEEESETVTPPPRLTPSPTLPPADDSVIEVSDAHNLDGIDKPNESDERRGESQAQCEAIDDDAAERKTKSDGGEDGSDRPDGDVKSTQRVVVTPTEESEMQKDKTRTERKGEGDNKSTERIERARQEEQYNYHFASLLSHVGVGIFNLDTCDQCEAPTRCTNLPAELILVPPLW